MDKKSNNVAIVYGTIAEEFRYSHDVFGEKFYTSFVEVKRNSGEIDKIPIMVSEHLVDVGCIWTGEYVFIEGQFRSFNKSDEKNKRLILHIFIQEFLCINENIYKNIIELDGFICKSPEYWKKEFGMEVCNLLIAVNRKYRKSDYIPCVCWGRNAKFASKLDIGTRIKIRGRIQSREYFKEISDGYSERRTAYEVSIARLEVMYENSNA